MVRGRMRSQKGATSSFHGSVELRSGDGGSDQSGGGGDGGAKDSSAGTKRSLLQRLQDAGVEVPVQRKIVGINHDLISRLYWPGDEHMTDEELDEFAAMKPSDLYHGINEPKQYGFPKAGGPSFGTSSVPGDGDKGPSNEDWEKWINSDGDDDFDLPNLGGSGKKGQEAGGGAADASSTGTSGADNASARGVDFGSTGNK